MVSCNKKISDVIGAWASSP